MNIVENKQLFIDQAKALLSGETNLVTNLANLSALYKEYLPNTNWVLIKVSVATATQLVKQSMLKMFISFQVI